MTITPSLKKALRMSAFSIVFFSATTSQLWAGKNLLTLEAAVSAAQKNDLWLVSNKHAQNAVESASVSMGTLPDPKMTIGFANLPTDTFDFGQEGMTQFKVGVSQMFPRGESLAIKRQQLAFEGRQYPYQRQDRKAKVAVIVSQLWLEGFKAQEGIALIEKNRALFEQLADVAAASYSSGLGTTRQHDIVRAQLELTRLEDRLTVLRQKQEISRQMLNEWLADDANFPKETGLSLSNRLPNIRPINEHFYRSGFKSDSQELIEILSQHPSIKALEQKINASSSGIELAKQQYKPVWGVSASYAYRDDNPMGDDRADLFSVGVSFDMPLFTSSRQDQQVKTAISETEAIKTEQRLLLRKLKASFETARASLIRLNQRKSLYQTKLLPQVHEQADASLTAYTNDDGDFSEVVRARIAELNASIDALNIDVDRQKIIVQLNYFFVASDSNVPVGK